MPAAQNRDVQRGPATVSESAQYEKILIYTLINSIKSIIIDCILQPSYNYSTECL